DHREKRDQDHRHERRDEEVEALEEIAELGAKAHQLLLVVVVISGKERTIDERHAVHYDEQQRDEDGVTEIRLDELPAHPDPAAWHGLNLSPRNERRARWCHGRGQRLAAVGAERYIGRNLCAAAMTEHDSES